MRSKLKLYTLLFITLFAVTSCEDKGDPPPPTPTPTPQTVLMHFPESGNLHGYFLDDIADVKTAVSKGALGEGRLLIFFETKKMESTIKELYHEDGVCKERLHATYTDLDITKAEGIAKVWETVIEVAPAEKYAMTIGAHGLAWLPAPGTSAPRAYAPREKEHWEYTSADGEPLTRWFGDGSTYSTNLTTLAEGITLAGINLEYILFDLCYMSTIEVAYDLRKVTKHIIASPAEIMAEGFPYQQVIPNMFTDRGASYNLQGICNSFYEFYSSYLHPCASIAVTVGSELDALADIMKRINGDWKYKPDGASPIQVYDAYNPHRFYDYGDYVNKLCKDSALLEEFENQLERAIPSEYRLHTGYYYAASVSQRFKINDEVYTGVMTSDPSKSSTVSEKDNTAWYKATH